jgi:hypothetical protein
MKAETSPVLSERDLLFRRLAPESPGKTDGVLHVQAFKTASAAAG